MLLCLQIAHTLCRLYSQIVIVFVYDFVEKILNESKVRSLKTEKRFCKIFTES